MNRKPKNHLRHQRGIAMIVALLALVLLAAIGMALMFMADTENSVNNNYKESQKAYFAARAGAENVRLQLASTGSLSAQALALTMPGQVVPTTGILYVTNPLPGETVDPTWPGAPAATTIASNPFLDDELCREQYNILALAAPAGGPCGSNNQSLQLLPKGSAVYTPVTMASVPGVNGDVTALPYKWVRITNKQNFMGALGKNVDGTTTNKAQQVCWSDGHQIPIDPSTTTCDSLTPNGTPVWILTSLAVTPPIGLNPGSRRMVQMEVALTPALIPPAPISTEAPVRLNGSFVLNAYDFCSCTCTPATSKTPMTCGGAGCKDKAHAIFTENTVTQVGGGTTVSSYGTDATGTASLQNQPWPDYLKIDPLIQHYMGGATPASFSQSCTGTADFSATPPIYKNCGTQSNQTTTLGTFPDSLTGLTPQEPATYTGGVTTYVPGSVKLTSGATGGGILIVDGDLEINGGLNWYGLVLVRGKVSFTGGGSSATNLFGAILAGQDLNATDQSQTDDFGGSINFHYDVCALKNSGGGTPPQLLATHEITY